MHKVNIVQDRHFSSADSGREISYKSSRLGLAREISPKLIKAGENSPALISHHVIDA